ncbi:MAG TPA: transglycosylase domain-containing protein [Candidatus Dormibacteraeota bacterium]|nr:transglycosylase domain-containing protein [Candidatus Dormibacteraeota bacterium]
MRPSPPARRRRAGVRTAAPVDTAGRGPGWWRRIPPRWRLGIRIALGLVAAQCLLLGGLVAYAALTTPDVSAIGRATGTIRIYDRHHTLITETGHDDVSRTSVPLAKVAPILQKATVAAEDRQFYQEGAFNFGRIAKALFVDVIARRPSQGASTITQQLAKLAFFGPNADKSPLRKLREALLANAIDRRFSKAEILEKYLNLIYYGHGAYGIQNAARTFFNKDASALDLREASLLAGLPQAPSYYDPFQNPDAAFARQHYVVSALVATGDITQAEADAVDPLASNAAVAAQNQQTLRTDLSKNPQSPAFGGAAPHFAQYVRETLEQQFADDPGVTDGDLEVDTTLDLTIQRQATAAVGAVATRVGHGANNAALLMISPTNGDILAMAGSADFANNAIGGQFNVVTAERRPGSSFKPYVYETGFKDGTLTPGTVLQDTRAESQALGGVKDFDGAFLGPISASRALVLSRNIPAEQAMTIAGVQKVIDFAHSLGITSQLAPNANTAIGSSSVRMIEHAAAYAAFANGGHKVATRAILKVISGQDTIVDAGEPSQGPELMSASQAGMLTRILRGYAGQWGLPFRHQTAGKSGTTDDFVDAWYMCYTPDFVVATWAGHTEGDNTAEIGMDGVYGTAVAKGITVPFVNSLPASVFQHGFDSSSGTPTPAPTPVPTETPAPEVTATPEPTPTPLLPLPTFGATEAPSPRASPTP